MEGPADVRSLGFNVNSSPVSCAGFLGKFGCLVASLRYGFTKRITENFLQIAACFSQCTRVFIERVTRRPTSVLSSLLASESCPRDLLRWRLVRMCSFKPSMLAVCVGSDISDWTTCWSGKPLAMMSDPERVRPDSGRGQRLTYVFITRMDGAHGQTT